MDQVSAIKTLSEWTRAGRVVFALCDLAKREFVDSRAVAKADRGLLQKRAAGQTFNICSGRLFSLREVLAMAEQITGHRMNVRVNPAFVRSNEMEKLCGNPREVAELAGGLGESALGGDFGVDVGGVVVDQTDCGSALQDAFDQLVNRGAAKGAWPVDTGRSVAQPGAADGFINPVARDLACVDTLVVTGKASFQPVAAIP